LYWNPRYGLPTPHPHPDPLSASAAGGTEGGGWRAVLTAELGAPPGVHLGPGAVAGVGVGLQLVAQQALIPGGETHVEHAAPEEGLGVHLGDALSRILEGGGFRYLL